MLFRNHSSRICTSAQSLRNGDEDAFAGGFRESEQKSRQLKVGGPPVANG